MLKHRRYYLPGKNLNNFSFGFILANFMCQLHVPKKSEKRVKKIPHKVRLFSSCTKMTGFWPVTPEPSCASGTTDLFK